jgi:hypothetical protein
MHGKDRMPTLSYIPIPCAGLITWILLEYVIAQVDLALGNWKVLVLIGIESGTLQIGAQGAFVLQVLV